MERKILKYPIQVTDEQIVQMPRGATILTIQKQMDAYCLWAIVNPEESDASYHIEIIGTGQLMDNREREYITTVIDDWHVWHFFRNFKL